MPKKRIISERAQLMVDHITDDVEVMRTLKRSYFSMRAKSIRKQVEKLVLEEFTREEAIYIVSKIGIYNEDK